MAAEFSKELQRKFREYHSLLIPVIAANPLEDNEQEIRKSLALIHSPAKEYRAAKNDLELMLHHTLKDERLVTILYDMLSNHPLSNSQASTWHNYSASLGTYTKKSVVSKSAPRDYGICIDGLPEVHQLLFWADVDKNGITCRNVVTAEGLIDIVSSDDSSRYLNKDSLGLSPKQYDEDLTKLLHTGIMEFRSRQHERSQ
jgi:hypothetical protein